MIVSALGEDENDWDYTLRLVDGYSEDFTFYSPYPNPSMGNIVNFKFQVITEQTIEFRIVDILGHEILNFSNHYSEPEVVTLEWNGKNKYCGTCGSETSLHLVEKAMLCKDCNNLIYPRISPCIIVLVTDNERLLLAHNKNFPTKIFSTLAGFIEVGETVEEAIQREIFEEVSIKVKNCQYYGSQSWPFPSQLMLGFHAEYEEGDLKPDGEEIDIAEWFHYKSLPDVPPGRISISGRLIESYVNKLTKKDLPGFT